MQFSIAKSEFQSLLQTASRALPLRTTQTAIEGFLLEAKDGCLCAVCTDLSMQIESSAAAFVEAKGRIVVPKLILDIVRRLPGETVEVTVDEQLSATIVSGDSLTRLQCMEAMAFPSMAMDEQGPKLTLSQLTFKDMIKKTIFSVSPDESKPVLMGLLLEQRGEELRMVGLDGYRLALRREYVEEAGERKLVFPAKPMAEISKVLGDSGEFTLAFDHSFVAFHIGNTSVITRLIDGEYMKYEQILPTAYATRVTIGADALTSAVERVALLAIEGGNKLIRLSITADEIRITSRSELGSGNERLSARIDGKELEIAFNALYMIDVLKVLDKEEVCLDFNTSVSPCYVHPEEGDAFEYLILPVRV